MAAHKDEKALASDVATLSLSAPNDGSSVDVNGCTCHECQCAFVGASAVPAATPQPFAYMPREVTAVLHPPYGEVSEALQRLPLVHPVYYAVLGVFQPIQLAQVIVPAPICVVPCPLYQLVNLASAAEQYQSQTQWAIPAAHCTAMMPTTPACAVHCGASATPTGATQVTDFPVPPGPVHTAAGAEPAASMPSTTQQGVSGDRTRVMPSQMTVDDVAMFIGQVSGCARYAEAFRRHQVDGQALMLMCKHHLILDMRIKLGSALKIDAAIKRLKRQQEEGLMRPPQ